MQNTRREYYDLPRAQISLFSLFSWMTCCILRPAPPYNSGQGIGGMIPAPASPGAAL